MKTGVIKSIIYIIGLTAIVCLFLNPAFAEIELKEKEPMLCYGCHSELQDLFNKSFVHKPFADGQCSSCHDVHAGQHKALIKEKINSLCLSCHKGLKKLMKESQIHGAIRNGICTDCHVVHGGDNKFLLVKSEKEICFKCHKELQDEHTKVYRHQPFDNGECSSCHNAHVSYENNLLRDDSKTLCKKCHMPGCKINGVSISQFIQDMDCLGCHSGHNTNTAGLLGPYGHTSFLSENCDACHIRFDSNSGKILKKQPSELCFGCHAKDKEWYNEKDVHATFEENPCQMCHTVHASEKKNLTVDERQLCITCHDNVNQGINHMIKRLKEIRCTPVKERQCMKCHAPSHAKTPYYFKVDSDVIKTCATCHEKEHKIAHPLGEGVIDPRDGSTITCKTCHSMHFARADFMLRYERSRELCIQCHKRY